MPNFALLNSQDCGKTEVVSGFGLWTFDLARRNFAFSRRALEILGLASTGSEDLHESLRALFGESQLRSMFERFSEDVSHSVVNGDHQQSPNEMTFRLQALSRVKAPRFFSMRGGLRGALVHGFLWESTLENQKIELALEGSGFGVWTFDPVTSKLAWDDRMYSIYGHSHESFDGSAEKWKQCLHPEDAALVATKFEELLNGKPVRIFEFRIYRFSDRAVRNIEANGAAQTDAQGNVRLVVGMNRDITLLKQERERLERERMALASSAKMAELGAMAAGIAHEINNPLAILMGRTGLLTKRINQLSDDDDLSTRLKKAAHADLEVLTNVSHRIADTVRGLRNYSRNADLDPKSNQPLAAILKDTLKLCTDRFKNIRLELDVDFESFAGISAFCRPTQISQVFLNLLNNSADSVEVASLRRIRIRALKKGSWTQIVFEDSGPGISPEQESRVFDPFYSTKQPGRGTGLGLSISKNIIESHGGRILLDRSFESEGESWVGCRFIVELPTSEGGKSSAISSTSANGITASEAASVDLQGISILAVDDETDILDVLKEELSGYGAHVATASNVEQAFDRLSKEHFDVLITDFAMPSGDGLSLIRRINRELSSRRPLVYLCTAYNVCSEEVAGELGILKVLTKPFNVQSFGQELSVHLSKQTKR